MVLYQIQIETQIFVCEENIVHAYMCAYRIQTKMQQNKNNQKKNITKQTRNNNNTITAPQEKKRRLKSVVYLLPQKQIFIVTIIWIIFIEFICVFFPLFLFSSSFYRKHLPTLFA